MFSRICIVYQWVPRCWQILFKAVVCCCYVHKALWSWVAWGARNSEQGFLIKKITLRLFCLWQSEYRKRGFQEVVTPNIYNSKLWQTSGHWQHYSENMFSFEVEKETFALKPMNCPGHWWGLLFLMFRVVLKVWFYYQQRTTKRATLSVKENAPPSVTLCGSSR